MSTVLKYEPKSELAWGATSIDKIGILTPKANINNAAFEIYREGLISLKEMGRHAAINFHAECLDPGRALLGQIVQHLRQLGNHGVLSPLIHLQLEASIISDDLLTNQPSKNNLHWFSRTFAINQIEMAFNFSGPHPWTILRPDLVRFCEDTVYSRDYEPSTVVFTKRGFYHQAASRSFLSIYDHAACHGYEGDVTRLEFRHCGSYAQKWDFLKLARPGEQLIDRYKNQIAGTLKKVLSPEAICFNLESIRVTHPSLALILARWSSWGKRAAG